MAKRDWMGETLLLELIMTLLCRTADHLVSYAKPERFSAFIMSTKVRSEASFISCP